MAGESAQCDLEGATALLSSYSGLPVTENPTGRCLVMESWSEDVAAVCWWLVPAEILWLARMFSHPRHILNCQPALGIWTPGCSKRGSSDVRL